MCGFSEVLTSEHRVRVSRRFGDALKHVPVFDDLAVVIKTENIDAGPITVSWPLLIAVQDNELTIGQHPAKLDGLPRVLARHAFEVRNECVLAVGDHRIVLSIA